MPRYLMMKRIHAEHRVSNCFPNDHNCRNHYLIGEQWEATTKTLPNECQWK